MRPATVLAAVVTLGAVVAAAMADAPADDRNLVARSSVGVVAAGTPEAAQIGAEILARGGNAVDAAVAASFGIAVSELNAGGLGGTAVILIAPPAAPPIVVDAPITVPVGADSQDLRQLHLQGRDYGWQMIAAPTAVAVLDLALKGHGTMGLGEVIGPAIARAKLGPVMGVVHAATLGDARWRLRDDPPTSRMFLDTRGEAWPPHARVPRPALATTLARLASAGSRDFYSGRIADAMLADMAVHGGSLTREDLRGVHARETTPIRGTFHDAEILSAGWPHGGASVLEALGILDHLSWRRLRRSDANRAHGLVEAVRIALGDRALRWIGDGDATVLDPQLDPRLWTLRARQVRFDRALLDAEIWRTTRPLKNVGGTTHLVVVDRKGMIVSVTLTIGNEYGAKVASPSLGFPYNDFLAGSRAGLTDDDEGPAAGTVIPTSMAPTVVLIGDHPVAALGSAGSERTISSVVEVLFNLLGTHLPVEEAVMRRRTLWCGVADPRVAIEIENADDEAIADALLQRGFPQVFRLRQPAATLDRSFFGGVQALAHDPGGLWVAVADPRRDGAASAAPSEP